MTKQAIIFDTDIGTDVDDVLALIVLIKSTRIKNVCIVTTNGPTAIRAQIARTLLWLLKKNNIPIFVGKSHSRTHTKIFTHGKEVQFIQTGQPTTSLRNLPFWCQKHSASSITIIATGPLTTTAWLINQENSKNRIRKIVWMGGSVQESGVPSHEHNLQTDLASARIVLKSGIPLFLIPLNASIKHTLTPNETQRFKVSKNKVGAFVWQGMKVWLNITKNFTGVDRIFNNKVFLHDPMTVLAGLKTNKLSWTKTAIDINKNGILSIPGRHPVNLCLSFPDELINQIKLILFSAIK